MKKSVVILIGIIYIAAIAVVSFFGLQFKIFEEIIPVESVEILNEGLKENEMWGKYVVISPDEDGNRRFEIKYRVYPDNATDNSVRFSYDTQTTGVTINEDGVVIFTEPGPKTVKVQVIAMDGSGKSASITIIAK